MDIKGVIKLIVTNGPGDEITKAREVKSRLKAYDEEGKRTMDEAYESARLILAGEMSSGDSYVVPAARGQVLYALACGLQHQCIRDPAAVRAIAEDLASKWSGGPCGPYTMMGMYFDGLLHGVYASSKGVIAEQAPQDWCDQICAAHDLDDDLKAIAAML